jgi:hypothetical protein
MTNTPRPLNLFDVLFMFPYLGFSAWAVLALVRRVGWCAALACGILLVLLLPILHRLYLWVIVAIVKRIPSGHKRNDLTGK